MPDLDFPPSLAGQEHDEFTNTAMLHALCKTLVGMFKDKNKSKKPRAGPEI